MEIVEIMSGTELAILQDRFQKNLLKANMIPRFWAYKVIDINHETTGGK